MKTLGALGEPAFEAANSLSRFLLKSTDARFAGRLLGFRRRSAPCVDTRTKILEARRRVASLPIAVPLFLRFDGVEESRQRFPISQLVASDVRLVALEETLGIRVIDRGIRFFKSLRDMPFGKFDVKTFADLREAFAAVRFPSALRFLQIEIELFEGDFLASHARLDQAIPAFLRRGGDGKLRNVERKKTAVANNITRNLLALPTLESLPRRCLFVSI